MAIEIFELLAEKRQGEVEASMVLAAGSHSELLNRAWVDLNERFDARNPEALANAEELYAAEFLSYWKGKARAFVGESKVITDRDLERVIGRPIQIGHEVAVFTLPTNLSPGALEIERHSEEGADKVTLYTHRDSTGMRCVNAGLQSSLATQRVGENFVSVGYQLVIVDGGFDKFTKTENMYVGQINSRPNSSRVQSLYLPDVRG